MQRLLNAWVWSATVLVVIIGFPIYLLVWLCTAPFDRGRYAAGRTFRLIAVTAVHLNPLWRFTVTGQAPRDPRRPYMVVSNHESYADVFLISMFPWEMKWMAKTTIFNIPVMGWMMRLSGDIPLVRGERTSAVAALAAARDRLARRVSVMIFPEGTRSRTPELLPFKDGAFRVAIECGAPILPIAVAGTRTAMAKGSFQFRPAVAQARVLDPIETGGLTMDDVPALRDRVRATIDEARHAIERELGLSSRRFADAAEG
ncbi:MAG: 1-acyl-sn-glycerol-3-phosphate acyltransferase [Gemmatimonadetes bacterium]|nr:1-acyl-sn-glycerol-3-phosphate acyltransferase [Gemmatimonadota bacterium]